MLTEIQKQVLLATADKIENDPKHYNQGCWIMSNSKPVGSRKREEMSLSSVAEVSRTSIIKDLISGAKTCNTRCCVAGWLYLNRCVLDKDYSPSQNCGIDSEVRYSSGLSNELTRFLFSGGFLPYQDPITDTGRLKLNYRQFQKLCKDEEKENARRVAELLRLVVQVGEVDAVEQWYNKYQFTMAEDTGWQVDKFLLDHGRIRV